jgi:lipid-A-disaccharide synthase-like uncharacterized protein
MTKPVEPSPIRNPNRMNMNMFILYGLRAWVSSIPPVFWILSLFGGALSPLFWATLTLEIMRILGVSLVLACAALAIFLTLRTIQATSSYDGSVLGEGWWQGNGVKGEFSPEMLPPWAAEVLQEGDRVTRTDVWNPDLRVGYKRLHLERAGKSLGRSTEGAAWFYSILGGIVVAPLIVWVVALVLFEVLTQRRPVRLVE